MSTSSDNEMSESSNSPHMYVRESPQSSPSQQVPQLTTSLTGLTCADNTYHFPRQFTKPFLRIIEHPQDHFRFRYVSEMVGTHGCLLGKSNGTNKTKTHPTVELVNYSGEAIIRCRLAQHTNPDEHPHKLLEDEQDRDVSYRVPEHGSYKVGFAGMGIIHTAKKDVPGLLVKKYSERCKNSNSVLIKDLRAHCENIAKTINLNIVRLRFSAHDPVTGNEICEPVLSEPIHNMKSAATNDLKISRISRSSGRPSGGEDVFILVEKVNKKNIMIRLFEMDENGERGWSSNGSFMQSDVHHQYAIVFRTPPYKDPRTPVDVQVYIELVRPSDGRTSEPKEFLYKAEQVYKKKRKMDSSYSSIESSNGSIKAEIPLPVFINRPEDTMEEYRAPAIPQVGVSEPSYQFQCDLGSALYPTPDASPLLAQAAAGSPHHHQPHQPHQQPQDPPILDLKLNSADFEKLLHNDTDMDPDDIRRISDSQYFKDYVDSYSDILPDSVNTMSHGYTSSMEFIHSMMYTDSGRAKGKRTVTQPKPADAGVSTAEDVKPTEIVKTEPAGGKKPKEYPAFYKTEDGVEVKNLVTELCQIMRNKNGYKKQDVRDKLERLFELRLSNGDTFLHMTLCSNLSSLEYIVKIINGVKMTHLLDYANDKQQTVLHLAVANDMPRVVTLLVAKGSNPMAKDHEDQNAVHYAVKYQACLEELLDAIQRYDVPCDLNDCNNEKQTPLHLAAIAGCPRAASLLLARGAAHGARDNQGRSPLHLAAYDNRLAVARALLDVMPPSDVDVTDGRGNTALQIVCGGSVRENTIEIAKLLLEKKADPLKQEEHNKCAWRLVRDQPALLAVLRPLMPPALLDDDVKSEPEDDYESADEGDMECGLAELALYGRELAALLDASGGWLALAGRVRLDSLLAWYRSQPSPATTLLNHLKDSRDDITSKSLALILDEIGYPEAAKVIRRHIN